MGKYKKTNVHFDRQVLETLKNDQHACVEIQHNIKRIALHPFHLNDINSSLMSLLYRGVTRYDTQLGGIILGYQNAKLENTAAVYDDNCFMHCDVKADFYLFKPEVGKCLDGIVTKKSKDHVGALVHNAFNISIPKTADWLGETVEIGQEIRMCLTQVDFERRLPFLKAELLSVLSESKLPKLNKITHFDDDEVVEESILTNKRKRSFSEMLDETPKSTGYEEEDFIDDDIPKPEKKKRKKNKSLCVTELLVNDDVKKEFSNSLEDLSNIDNYESPKKKSKKKKSKTVENFDDIDNSEVVTSLEDYEQIKITDKLHKSKIKKKKDTGLEISEKHKKRAQKKLLSESEDFLPDLNLDKLFQNQESITVRKSNFDMADMEDKAFKRQKSFLPDDIQLDDKILDLPHDSDLESILSFPKKHKKSI